MVHSMADFPQMHPIGFLHGRAYAQEHLVFRKIAYIVDDTRLGFRFHPQKQPKYGQEASVLSLLRCFVHLAI